MASLEIQVGGGADDTFTNNAAVFSAVAPVVNVGRPGASSSICRISMRFEGVSLPDGSTLTSAVIRVKSSLENSSTPLTRVFIEDADAPDPPTTSVDFDARILTTGVDWSPAAFALDVWYDSPDILSILEPVLDRAGFGNIVQIFWKDNGSASGNYRQVYQYDNLAGDAPKLIIGYTAVASGYTHMTLLGVG